MHECVQWMEQDTLRALHAACGAGTCARAGEALLHTRQQVAQELECHAREVDHLQAVPCRREERVRMVYRERATVRS